MLNVTCTCALKIQYICNLNDQKKKKKNENIKEGKKADNFLTLSRYIHVFSTNFLVLGT